MRSLPVLYLDEQLVAVNKPSGLLVHRSDIDRHETENAMKIVRDQMGQWVFPVHRLDKATSGVLVFALDRETARLMTTLFTDAKVSKTYLAVVRGFTPDADRIDHPLKDRWDKMTPRPQQASDSCRGRFLRPSLRDDQSQCNLLLRDVALLKGASSSCWRGSTDQSADKEKPAKNAVTDYRRLATVELPYPVGQYASARFSLVQAAPRTGRNHQIRRHMKHVFHPIINDTTYGDGKQNDFFRRHFQCRRLLLHARSISFSHPCTDQLLHIEAPLDEAFNRLLEILHWEKL